MTVNPVTLPASLKDEIEAASTFRKAQAFAERATDPDLLLGEIARLTDHAAQSDRAAAWLLNKGLATFAKRCAREALAAACAAALLACRLPAGAHTAVR